MRLQDIRKLNELIIVRTSEEELNSRLAQQIDKKLVGGEQWFRSPKDWHVISSYMNPYKSTYEEIPILLKYSTELEKCVNRTLKVFWGLGIADSEIIPVLWDLHAHKYVEINAMDAIKYFIQGFISALRNLILEYPSSRIMFVGNNTLFENMEKRNVKPENAKYKKATHTCFGNTIGNFDQAEIFEIFKRNTDTEDYLLLAYQLKRNPKKILSMYMGNQRFEKIIMNSIDRGYMLPRLRRLVRHLKGRKLEWKYNKKEDYVEAWLNDILAFRSKKYDPEDLAAFAKRYNFELVKSYVHGDCGVSLFEKT